ncbi:MAG: hypothetical protein ACREFX_06860, partial [Opitutaceae bacterium]
MTDPAAAAAGAAADRDNPWPGLSSFTEDLRGYFFGREKETEELVRLVRRNTLTVLFGQSGLGKSSLLQAGVFPLLREADFLPLYLRLDHDPGAPPLADQVKVALTEALRSAGADAPAPRPDQTLWEYFHRKDIDIWSAKNRLLTPVLAFDQFEEIFTLGRADDARRERGRAFLTELADLVENRPPAPLQAKFDSAELDPAKFAFDKPACQVILSLREDFLPDLEGLKGEMRSLMLNRMRVRRLTGTQALEIVSRPAPHLLGEGVAERVVEFVAGGRGGSAERLAELEVEPALLSVICRELNQRRRALGQEQITADLVSGNRREILNDFYERSAADLPSAMREFVEDHLLTKSGFRDNLALETALETPGVTRPLIDTLVARRLLRIEDRLGMQRVELTHDVLADVIRASRDSRQQRLALESARAEQRQVRRRVWWLRGIAAGLVVLLAGVSFAAYRSARAGDRKEARSDLVLASQFMERGDAPPAITYLVRAAETDGENPVAGTRLISALAGQSWPIWRSLGVTLPTLGAPGFPPTLALLPGGRLLVLRSDGVVSLIDLQARRLVREYRFPGKGVVLYASPGKSGRFFVVTFEGGAPAAPAAHGGLRSPLEDHPTYDVIIGVASAAHGGFRLIPAIGASALQGTGTLSPDGKWAATASGSTLLLIDMSSGRVVERVTSAEPRNPANLDFSPDSTKLAVADWIQGVEILRVPTLATAVPWFRPSQYKTGGAADAVFSPDGASCAVSWWDGARLFDAATGLPEGPALPVATQCQFLLFGPRGRRLFVFGNDRTVRIFDLATRRETVPPLRHGAAVAWGQLSADGQTLMTWSDDDRVHLWDTRTGTQLVQSVAGIRGPRSVALAPDGRRVLYCAPDGRIGAFGASALQPVVWTPGGQPVPIGNGGVNSTLTNFYRDVGRTLYHLEAGGIRTLSLNSFLSDDAKRSFPANGQAHDSDMTLGLRLVSFPNAGFSVWSMAGDRKIRDLIGSPMRAAYGRFLSSHGPIMLVAPSGGNTFRVGLWPVDGGPPLGPEIVVPNAEDLSGSVSPDHSQIALGTASGWAGIWNIATGRRTVRMENELRGEISMTLFSPDGRFMATGGYNSGISADGTSYAEGRLWNARTGQPLSRELRHLENFVSLAFSQDSKLAAFASVDGTVDVVSTATGKPLYPALACPDAMIAAAAPGRLSDALAFVDSDTIAAATAREVCLWDARSGLPAMEPYPAGTDPIDHMSHDRAGTDVALVGGDGRASVWPLPPRYARAGVPRWLLQLAQTLAGERLDREGDLVPSDAGFVQTQAALA